jgi:ribonucleoside-triphosphate reductase
MAEIIVKKKRGGVVEPFDREKIHAAIRKSADRVLLNLTDEDCNKVSDYVINHIKEGEVTVRTLHKIVEVALDETGFPKVAKSYRQYRNYKIDARKIMEAVDAKTLELTYKEDRSNANSDSLLVSTKRSILFGEMQKEKYKRLFLNTEELEAIEKGFIYIHDIKDRLSTMNCNLCNIGRILKDGFTLANLTYTEPKSLSAAMSVTTDIISAYAGQQYGGTTIPQIDEVMIPYAEKSYNFYLEQYKNLVEDVGGEYNEDKADQFAYERTKREAEQQYQHMEHSMNSIASSRGDFAFISFTFGHSTNRWAKMLSNVFLDVRRGGQGKEDGKVPVLFPKLIFLYDSELHGEGKELEDLFDNAVETSKQCMYPDFLSLDKGYVADIYHKYGKIISPMGRI